MIELESATLS